MSKFKTPVATKPMSSQLMPPATKTATSTMPSTMIAATAPSSNRKCKRWGLPCPFCIQSALHHSPVDSDWSEEDWDGDIEREKKNKVRGEEAKTENRRRGNIGLLSPKPHI